MKIKINIVWSLINANPLLSVLIFCHFKCSHNVPLENCHNTIFVWHLFFFFFKTDFLSTGLNSSTLQCIEFAYSVSVHVRYFYSKCSFKCYSITQSSDWDALNTYLPTDSDTSLKFEIQLSNRIQLNANRLDNHTGFEEASNISETVNQKNCKFHFSSDLAKGNSSHKCKSGWHFGWAV